MRSSTTLALLCSALISQVAAQVPEAEVVMDNPVSTVYKATLPENKFFKDAAIDGNVKGYVIGQSSDDGLTVEWKVELSNLPAEGGPFSKLSQRSPF